jgi:hypothetical protein
MDKLIALGIGIGVGYWLKCRADERAQLKRENLELKAKLEGK